MEPETEAIDAQFTQTRRSAPAFLIIYVLGKLATREPFSWLHPELHFIIGLYTSVEISPRFIKVK